MYATIAKDGTEFDTAAAQTVASASFPIHNHQSSMTFLVPRGYWYRVMTDGGRIKPTEWTEYFL
jgi:hypothetical protein